MDQEIRDGYIVSSEMKKVWQIQLELVKKLLDVCKRHNLKIWADGGTLLGAIRHQGYIPWDDDIDMMMMREDYDKLVSISASEFTGNIFLQCAETEKNYIRGHAQLRRSDTTAILPKDLWQTFNQGIFIDIFVYDYLPATEQERIKCFHDLEKERKYLYNWFYGSVFSRNPINHIISRFYISSNGGYKKCYDKMVKGVLGYPNTSNTEVGSVLWTANNYKKYIKDVEWYKDTVYIPFESIMIPVPSGYDNVLKRVYGNYMTPVKAPSYHGSVIFNTERSYKEVLSDLRNKPSFKQKLQRIFSLTPSFD